MPLYEYKCKQCDHRFEKIQSFSAPDEKACPRCGGEVERLISAPAIQFKGSGFYLTDYGKAGAAKGGESGASESGAGAKPGAASGTGNSAAPGSASPSAASASGGDAGAKPATGGGSTSSSPAADK